MSITEKEIKQINDDGLLKKRYQNKKVNAKKEGILFNLTFEEYCELVKNAGLISSQLGFTGEKYVLARYNDEGDYSINNCRFITQHENALEKKNSDKSKKASAQNIKKYYNNTTSEERYDIVFNSEGWKKYNTQRKQQSIIKKQEKEKQLNQSYTKEHNSQYNTYWITNGEINKKWKDEKGPIPQGFYKGRINVGVV